tara:strand:- start:396 stop:650 length:255 start_codon:yes stop_codon:yes gene_type:complete
MSKTVEWYIIIFLVLTLIVLGGCAKKVSVAKNPTLPNTVSESTDSESTGSSIGNLEGIAEVLGCMFAPNECTIKKRQEEQKLDR